MDDADERAKPVDQLGISVVKIFESLGLFFE
jgi:hypothetical protein